MAKKTGVDEGGRPSVTLVRPCPLRDALERVAWSIERGAVIGPSIAAGGRCWFRDGKAQTGPRCIIV